MTEQPEQTFTTYEATYVGRRLAQGGKVMYRYLDNRDGQHYGWSSPIVKGGTIGAVYQFTEKDSGSVFVSGQHAPTYLRSLSYDDPDVLAWRAADLVVEQDKQRAAAIRKAGDPFDEVVQLVERAALNLTRPQRRALAARLMEALFL